MTRVKNPQLLRNLHEVWTVHGCGICGDQQVELHHVVPRGQQGADSAGNIVGLCGAFTKNHHHLEVTENRIRLTPSSGGWGWKNQVTGEWGYVRLPKEFESGADAPVSVGEQPPITAPPAPDPAGVPESSRPGMVVSNPLHTGSNPAGKLSTPELRFEFLQRASREAAGVYMTMAVILDLVKASGEWQNLGFDAFRDYWGENGLGLPSGTVSKMLKVAAFYKDEWTSAMDSGASVEKLYLAAGVASEPSEAIGLAASMPTFELKALAKGEAAPEDQPRCAECGQRLPTSYEGRKHEARQERVAPDKETDA